ncbi:MAG: glycosyltransferase [Hyphomicrobiales bacterium]|nr:glycosyltransferase [Hyphomicrobiales bacterium]
MPMAVEATRDKSARAPSHFPLGVLGADPARAIAGGLRRRLVTLFATARTAPGDLVPGLGAAVAAVILVLACALLLDKPVVASMRHLPLRVTRFFHDITTLGEGWVWMLPLALAALALAWASLVARSRRQRARLVVYAERAFFMFSAIALPSLATTILKHVVGRVRPRAFESLGAFHFEPFSFAASKASFPSGHATTVAALVVALGAVAPRWKPAVMVLAFFVFFSRVAVEAHYASDVLAGAFIGIAGASAMRRLFAKVRIGLRSGMVMAASTQDRAAHLSQGGFGSSTWPLDEVTREPLPAPRLSIVVPMRNESENAGPLIEEIERACAGLSPFEIICVDDGSSDKTASRLTELGASRANLRAFQHAISCGQSAAVRTGVRAARAPIVATIDGDGQNDPSFIPKLLEALEAGGATTGLVAGQRVGRKDTGFKKLQSRVANMVRGRILRDGTRDTGCGLKAFRREVFLALPYFDGLHRFLPALMRREGYEVRLVDVVDRPRRAGRSNYGLFDRLWVGILDLAGVWWLIRRRRRVPIVSNLRKDA